MAASLTFTKGELIELIPCILEEIERAEEQGREDDKTQFEEELKHFHGLFLQREDDGDDDDDDDASEASRLFSSSRPSDLMDIDNTDGSDTSSLLSGRGSSDDFKDTGDEYDSNSSSSSADSKSPLSDTSDIEHDAPEGFVSKNNAVAPTKKKLAEQKGKAVLKLRGHHAAKGKDVVKKPVRKTAAKGKEKEKEKKPQPKYNCKCGCGSKNVSRQKILDHKKAKGKRLHCNQTKDNGEPCTSISGTARDFKDHHKTVHHWTEEQLKGVQYDWSEGREDGFTDPEDPNWTKGDERYVEEPEEEAEEEDDDDEYDSGHENEDGEDDEDIE